MMVKEQRVDAQLVAMQFLQVDGEGGNLAQGLAGEEHADDDDKETWGRAEEKVRDNDPESQEKAGS